jgi:uncharacterized membrane protein YedE/YeeE
MFRLLSLFAGALFGLGACISGMVRPSKVIAFLDFHGAWDPSLALVMGAGMAIHAIAWRLSRPPKKPLFGEQYPGPPSTQIDKRVLVGAAIFGLGWGLGGFCPGPAVVSTVSLVPGTLVFAAAMLGGMVLAKMFAGADGVPVRKAGDAAS